MSGTTLKGALLVSGTMVGGGMLALPVLTSSAGFLPSIAIYFLCWCFMALTGLLILEVFLWMKGEANLVSMAGATLGLGGKAFAWVLYLFLFFCLMTAYIVGVGQFLSQLMPTEWKGAWIVFLAALLIMPILIKGTTLAGKINVGLMAGLILSYLLFVWLGFSFVNLENLQKSNWSKAMGALPIAFTAFAYQGIVPTLSIYLNRDVKKLRKAILFGTFIPLLAYVLWQFLILGIIPALGAHSLSESAAIGESAVAPLKYWIESPSLEWIGQSFAFFALLTSFLGVALGLMDFLSDGLQIPKVGKGRWLLASLVLLPPAFIGFMHPGLFLSALETAGGLGCALLLGLLPIIMVWVGRKNFPNAPYKVFGGTLLLSILLAFVLFEVGLEISHLIGV